MKLGSLSLSVGLAIVASLSVQANWSYDFASPYASWNLQVLSGSADWTITGGGVGGATGDLSVSAGGEAYIWTTVAGVTPTDNYVYLSINRTSGDTFGYYRWTHDGLALPSDFNLVPYPPYSADLQLSGVTAGEKFGFSLANPAIHATPSSLNIKNFQAPVPEPQTYAVASGLALIGFVAYRRFRRMPPA